MQKRISRLPFLGFLLLFVVPIAAVFLLAHDARNLKQLTRWAGLPLESGEPPPVEIRATPLPVEPSRPGDIAPQTRLQISRDARSLAEPAPAGERAHRFSEIVPEKRCQSISRFGQSAPDFFAVPTEWTCLAELRYPNSNDVLFLQVTGRAKSERIFRAKLNLYDGRSLTPMAMDMAQALQLFEPVNPAYVARLVQQVIDEDREGEWILGYGRMEIARESGAGRRYNIFVRQDPPRTTPATPNSGFRLTQSLGRPTE